ISEAEQCFEESLAVWSTSGFPAERRGLTSRALSHLGAVALSRGDTAAARRRFEAAAETCRPCRDLWGLAAALRGLGLVAQAAGAYDAAEGHFRESLQSWLECGNREGIAGGLETIAGVVGARGDYGRAARLFGAAAGLREAIASVVPPPERAGYDRGLGAVRA